MSKAMERATHFRDRSAGRGAGRGRRTEGEPERWEPAPECWLWTQEGEGIKGAIVQDEGGGKGDTDMPTQTTTCTPRDTQADSRTGAAGHTHMGTREEEAAAAWWSSEGLDTPTGDQEQRDSLCTYPRIGSQGDAVTHWGKEESLSLSHACMRACVRAYITVAHCHAVTKDPVTHEHTCAHMCAVMQSSLLAMTVTVTQSNKKHNNTSIHVYTT